MDRANRKKPHLLSASLLLLLAGLAAGLTAHTAQAAGNAKASKVVEPSAMEQYRDMSQNERADLANEATLKSTTVTRAATAAERAMMSEKPAQARERLSQRGKTNETSIAQRAGADSVGSAAGSPVGKEFRSGNSVGKIVGTAFMHGRKIIRTKDGLHLETCESGVHAHGAQTADFLNNIARDSKKGVGRE